MYVKNNYCLVFPTNWCRSFRCSSLHTFPSVQYLKKCLNSPKKAIKQILLKAHYFTFHYVFLRGQLAVSLCRSQMSEIWNCHITLSINLQKACQWLNFFLLNLTLEKNHYTLKCISELELHQKYFLMDCIFPWMHILSL